MSELAPEFLFVDKDPEADDIRKLLRELHELEVVDRTAKLFAGLAMLEPAVRLSMNLCTLSDIMSERPVSNVLVDGLTRGEHNALLELDVLGATTDSRITARALLNVKERWIMVKTLGGLFKSHREMEGGYLRV